MANTLEGALAGVPGLGGYLGAQQFNTQQDGAQLQQASGVMRLADALRGQSEERQLREIVSKGGAPEAVISALLRTGPKGAEAAHKYAQALGELSKQKIIDSVGGTEGVGLTDSTDNAERLMRASIVHPNLGPLSERMTARIGTRQQLPMLQSQTVPITAQPTLGADGVNRSVIPAGGAMAQPPGATEPIPAEVAAQMSSGQPFSTAVGEQLPSDLQKVGGMFTPFLQSANPATRQEAARMTQYVNSLSDRTITPDILKRLETRAEQMGAAESRSDERRTMQQIGIDAAKSAAQIRTDNKPEGRDKLVSVIGPDGKTPTFVRESEAEGMTPFSASMHGGTASGREAIFNKRIILSSNQAMKDLENVVQLPLSASTGILGGRRQGPGLFDAGKEVLANKMTSQESQSYNAMATGFQRSLATIEAAGLMPSGSLTHQMDAVIFKEGDTNLTKMHKLAQTRQIVESGLEVLLADDRVPKEIKDQIAGIVGRVEKAVPFTHQDLTRLTQEQQINPKTTLKDVMQKNKKTGGVEYNGYQFPSQEALDKYKAATGK